MSGRLLQEAQPYTVPEGGAMGILFGVLCLTGLLCVAGISAWYSIALSFFASGMGAWIVYGTTEMGATRPISWWASSATRRRPLPAVLLCWLGPRIKTVVGAASGFSATDFALSRYGRLMHLHVCCISCFYMYIYMVAELTSIGNVYATLVGKSVAGDDSENFTTKIAICVALFTWAYTALAGLPASILTDKFQGVVITCVVIMLLVATTTLKSNEVSKQEYDDATGWFSKGFEALVTLWIAICSAELFNQGNWQRVWAARSDKDMKIGFLAGAVLNGIASVLSRDLLKQKLNTNWSRLVVVGFNIAAIIQASDRFEVVPLFLVADLVCATAVFPLFLGLWTDDLVVGPLTIPAPTELGAFLGALAGIAAVMVNGEINDVNKAVNPYTGKVYDKLMVTFIVVPLVSAAATVIFSYVDVYVGGDKAKQPFIIVPRRRQRRRAPPGQDLELDAIQVADDEKKSPEGNS
ncbi:sodium solute symporter [Aureococcus anophagefferens]|nr:sodium solute symporter [Aureococcus anophagefferens]